MDLIEEAKKLFKAEKPEHFTNYTHCEECAEHDQTLLNSTIDTITINELGYPGWDPICFSSVEGKKYYMPSLIRLSLETVLDELYFSQLLFHLENYELFLSCSMPQREFIAKFVEHMINSYPETLEAELLTDDALKVHEIWSKV